METLIDINSDLGESPEALASGADFELMRYITSANVACGGHAGDENTMRQTIAAAKELNVAVGAHPSYPDRENFGRLDSPMPPAALEDSVRQQIASLVRVAGQFGVRLIHVKAHGALYHATNKDREIALAVGRAVQEIDPQLIMVGQAGASALEVWREMGLRSAAEAFADRAYLADGRLADRGTPGAVLTDADEVAGRAVALARDHRVTAVDGTEITVRASSICVHGDTPGAASLARSVRRALEAAGVTLAPFAAGP